MLVNALLLPQQGSITKFANTKARVRGAVGIANGTVVTMRVGGVGVLNGAAVGVVGNYTQVEAGSAAVSLGVNGVAVTVPNQTLVAGGEYTLLVWSNADGAQTTLIEDDNRLPTASGKAKIRVLNGLSALNVPDHAGRRFLADRRGHRAGPGLGVHRGRRRRRLSARREQHRHRGESADENLGLAAVRGRLHAVHVGQRRDRQRDVAEGSLSARAASCRMKALSLSRASVSGSPDDRQPVLAGLQARAVDEDRHEVVGLGREPAELGDALQGIVGAHAEQVAPDSAQAVP